MTTKKSKPKLKKNPADEKISLKKGQMLNIIYAAEKRKNCCPAAIDFIKKIKSDVTGKRKAKKKK